MVDPGEVLSGSSGGTATLDADGDEVVDTPDDQPVDEPSSGQQSLAERLWGLLRPREIWLIALVTAPFVVSALALIFAVGGDYLPASDHALTELQIRDVGRHPVLVGLYSRADWNHPGPAEFYLLAPFYRLSGGSSIGMNLGTLAVNAASVVGMALIAWRRGGKPLLLCTLLGCALLMRTVGAEFLLDPWNCFISVLPFGLMIFLTWALLCGEVWALPFAVFVASFLVQVHVGYVALALPLLALGTASLVLPAVRDRGDPPGWRKLLRPGLVGAAVGAVVWLPVFVDVLVHRPNNLHKITRWFNANEEGTHTFGEGWRIMTGQFGATPEWLIDKRPFASGRSPFQDAAPLPLWLLLLAAAAVMVWRRGRSDDRRLVLVLGCTLLLGVVAIVRTVGVAFEYRLRWTWIPPMVAFVLVAWIGWQLVAKRWPRAVSRGLVPVAVVGLVVLTGVNGYTAATAGVPQNRDPEVLATLMPGVREAIGEGDGQVLVDDPFQAASWYMRGVVLQLERRGVDVRVTEARSLLFGEHRVVDDDRPVRARLLVVMDDVVPVLEANPDMRMVARWRLSEPEVDPEGQRRLDALEADYQAGRLDAEEYVTRVIELDVEESFDPSLIARDVAVFLDVGPPGAFGQPASQG